LPAVALSAFGRADDRISALKAGFHMHVTKPVESAELVITVRGMILSRSGPDKDTGQGS
jgi:DNA-binding response OmpR family regulator